MKPEKGSELTKKTYKTADELRKEEQQKKAAASNAGSMTSTEEAKHKNANKGKTPAQFTIVGGTNPQEAEHHKSHADMITNPEKYTPDKNANAASNNGGGTAHGGGGGKHGDDSSGMTETEEARHKNANKKKTPAQFTAVGGSLMNPQEAEHRKAHYEKIKEKTGFSSYMYNHNLPIANSRLDGDWVEKMENGTLTTQDLWRQLAKTTVTNEDIFVIDGRPVTISDLRRQGYSESVINTLLALTHRKTVQEYSSSPASNASILANNMQAMLQNAQDYMAGHPDEMTTYYLNVYSGQVDAYDKLLKDGSLSKSEREQYRDEREKAYANYLNTLLYASDDKYIDFALEQAQKERDELQSVYMAVYAYGDEETLEKLKGAQDTINGLTNRIAKLQQIKNARETAAVVEKVESNGDGALMRDLADAYQANIGSKSAAMAAALTGGDPYIPAQAENRSRYMQLEADAKQKGYTDADIAAYAQYLYTKDYDKTFGPYLKWIQEHPVAGPVVAGAVQVLSSPVRGMTRLLTGAASAETPNAADPGKMLTDAVKQGTEAAVQGIVDFYSDKDGKPTWYGKSIAKVYQWSASAAESAVMMVGTGGSSPVISAIMGMNAAADSYDEALARGLPAKQAAALGVTSGVFEALFEWLSLDKIKWFNNTKLTGKKAWATMLAKSMFVEGSEEVNTDLANLMADFLIAGGLSEYNTAMAEGKTPGEFALEKGWELLDSFLGGAFSGGLMGATSQVTQHGFSSIVQHGVDKSAGRAVDQYGDVTELLDQARNSGDEELVKLSKRIEQRMLDGKSTTYQQGKLYNLLQAKDIRAAAKQAALDKGASEKQADAIADGIADAFNRQPVDPGSATALESEIGRRVAQDFDERSAAWSKELAGKYRERQVVSGVATDRAARAVRNNNRITETRAEINEAMRGGKSYALIENGFEGRMGGEDGAEVKLGGVVELNSDGKLVVAVDYDAKDGSHAEMVYDPAGAAGTVRSTDAGAEELYGYAVEFMAGIAGQDAQIGTLYPNDGGVKMSAAAANDMIYVFEPAVNPDTAGYCYFFNDAYKAGRSGVSWGGYLDVVGRDSKAEWADIMTETQLREAFRAGQMEFSPAKGVTRIGTARLSDKALNRLSVLDGIMKKLGFSVIAVDTIEDKNGYVSDRADVAVINLLDADKGLFEVAAFHEVLHVVTRELGVRSGRQFVDAVLGVYRETVSSEQYDRDYAKVKKRYGDDLEKLDEEGQDRLIKEELAAQYFAGVATNHMDRFVARLEQGGRELLTKVREALQAFADELKKALNRLAGLDPATAAALRTEAAQAERIFDLFEEAARQAEEAREQRLAEQGETLKQQAENAEFSKDTGLTFSNKTYSDEEADKIISSFGITKLGDYRHVQQKVYNTLKAERFFDDGKKAVVIHSASGMEVQIDKNSIEEAFNAGNFAHIGKALKIAKLHTIRHIKDVIKKGILSNDDIANYHNNKSGLKYAYIVKSITIEGTEYEITAAIRKAPQVNRFWMHKIEIKSAKSKSAGEQISKTDVQLLGGENTIPQSSAGSQEKNSGNKITNSYKIANDSENDRAYMAAVERGDMDEAQRMVDEAAKAAGYDTPKLYHGSGAFGFTEFDLDKGEHAIFASSNLDVAKTYVGETDRMEISERATENIDALKGEELLTRAKKQFPGEYDGYYLVSQEEKNDDANVARNKIRTIAKRAVAFKENFDGAFNTEKEQLFDSITAALGEIAEAADGDALLSAKEKYENLMWDLKWMDESIQTELSDAIGKQLNDIVRDLDTALYKGDLYRNAESAMNEKTIFDNQLALELDAAIHKGVYQLYGKMTHPLEIDAKGANWNDIRDWIPNVTKKETRVRPAGGYYELVENRTGNILESIERNDTIKSWSTGKIHELLIYKATEKQRIMYEGPKTTRFVSTYAFNHGYDSVVIRNLRDVSTATDYRGTGDVYIFNAKNAVKSADAVTYDDDGKVIPLSERFNEKKEDIRYSRKVEDARGRFDAAAVGGEMLGQMLDETLKLLHKAHTELDKAQYDAWLQGETTEGRVKTRKGVLSVVKKYNDEKLTGVSNEDFTDRIMQAFMDLKDYDYGAEELVNAVLDVMADKAAAQVETVENETRDIIREITNGAKYVVSDGAFRELTETLGGRRAMNDVFRTVYGFTLVPEREAQRRGASVSFDAGMQEVTEALPGLFANSSTTLFSYDADNGSVVNMATALFEMQDAMQVQERTAAEELGLDKLDPDSDEALEATMTLYERAYQDAIDMAEDLIRLTPVRTLADTYVGRLDELRQAAKGQLQARQKEIVALMDRIETAEVGVSMAAQVNRTLTGEAAKMERQIGALERELADARYALRQAEETGRGQATALAEKVSGLEEQIKGLKEDLKKERAKVTRRDVALIDARADRDARLKAQREYYQEMRHRQVVQRQDTANKQKLRKQIVHNVLWLNRRLATPTDKQHIPEELRTTVGPFVEAFAAMQKTDLGWYMFKKDNIDDLLTFYRRLNDADEANHDTAAENSVFYGKYYVKDIDNMLQALKETVGGKRFTELTAPELSMLDNIMAHIRKMVEDGNDVFLEGKRVDFADSAGTFIRETKEKAKHRSPLIQKIKDGADGINIGMAKPIYLFKEIVGGEISRYFDEIREAQNRWAFMVSDAAKVMQEIKDRYHYKEWKNDGIAFTLTSGETLVMTKDAVLQIYATYKREQAQIVPSEHLTKGGIVLSDELEGKQTANELRKALKSDKKYNTKRFEALIQANRENITRMAHHLTIQDIVKLGKTLTDEQRAYADAVVKYMSSTVSEWGNETSMAMYGYKKFNEKYYFPFQSSSLFLHQSIGMSEDARIKNKGFTKPTVKRANNPIVITGFSEVAAQHIGEMASYSALTAPLEDINRLLQFKLDDGKSVKEQLAFTYGGQVYQYMNTFITQMNGGTRQDVTVGTLNKLTGNFKRAAVALNFSVMVQQPSAVARAMAMVDPKYFVRTTGSWFDYKNLMKYSGVAVIKSFGGIDTDVGKSTKDYILGESNYWERLSEWTGKGAEVMDNITWSHIWNAVKRETAHEMGIKYHRKGMSEEFYRRAAARFNEVADYTQVYDSTISRSQMMRSQDTGMKMATAFMAEPTTTYNMLMFSGMKKNGKAINKGAALGAFVCNVVLNTALQSLVGAWRDKDDESYWERWFKRLVQGVFGTRENAFLDSEFNLLNMIPFIKDFMSIMQGYDVERSDMQLFTDLWKSFDKLRKAFANREDDEALFDFIRKNAELLASFGVNLTNLTPIPLKSLYRDFWQGGKNAFEHLRDGDFHTTAQHIANIWKQNFEGEWDKNEQLYYAVLQGDKELLDRYTKVTPEDYEKYINSKTDELAAIAYATNKKTNEMHEKIAKALTAMDERIEKAARLVYFGDVDKARKLADAVAEDGFSISDVYKAIQLTGKELFPNDEEYSNKIKTYDLVTYDMLDRAYYDDNTFGVRELRDALIEQGKTAETVNKHIADMIDEDFATGEIGLAEAKKAYGELTTYTDKKITDRLTKQAAELYANDGELSYEGLRGVYQQIGVTEDDLGKQMADVVVNDYIAGKFTDKNAAVAEYMKQTGETDEKSAALKFDYEDAKARDENYPLTFSNYKKYVESGLEETGVSVAAYDQFLTATKNIDSKTTSAGWEDYSARMANVKSYNKFTAKQWHYVQAIEETFDTVEQKDAAYKATAAAENWSLAKLPLTPWH